MYLFSCHVITGWGGNLDWTIKVGRCQLGNRVATGSVHRFKNSIDVHKLSPHPVLTVEFLPGAPPLVYGLTEPNRRGYACMGRRFSPCMHAPSAAQSRCCSGSASSSASMLTFRLSRFSGTWLVINESLG